MLTTVEKNNQGEQIIRFERFFKHSVDKVWSSITQREKMAQWTTAKVDIEMTVGGKIEFIFGNTGHTVVGKITQLKPPTLIEYTWNSPNAQNTLLRWELHSKAEGCTLILTQTFIEQADIQSMMAGWHVHLDMLSHEIKGEPIEFPWERWEELHEKYKEMIG